MKNKGKLIVLMGAMMLAPALNSQGLLNMFKKNNSGGNNNSSSNNVKKPVLANPYAKDFSDDAGIGGAYFASDTIWLTESGGIWDADGYSSRKKDDKGNYYYSLSAKFQYTKEKDDNVINLLSVYASEFTQENYKYGPKLDEKMQKTGTTVFSLYPSASKRYTYMQLEKDVFAYIFSGDNFENAKVLNVFAKDKAMLETYDKETALAKMQQLLKKADEEKNAKIKEDLLKNETYAKMKGKVGFVTHYNQTGASYGKITEKPDVFISSVEIGKPFYWRAYYDVVPDSKCGDGCNRNVIFEIDGVKMSWMELRKKSSTWSGKLEKTRVDNDYFSMCPTMINAYYSNWALVSVLYQIKDKFSEGKSFKCKMTVTNYRDGVDQDILAEGTINLVYKAANQSLIDTIFGRFKELDNN